MTQIVGLFSDGAAATKVVESLVAHDIGPDDYRVLEGPMDTGVDVGVVPVPPSGSARGAVVGGWPNWGALDIDDEAADFFRRTVEDGATLVVVDVDDDKIAELRHVFEENGGRVATE